MENIKNLRRPTWLENVRKAWQIPDPNKRPRKKDYGWIPTGKFRGWGETGKEAYSTALEKWKKENQKSKGGKKNELASKKSKRKTAGSRRSGRGKR